MLYGNRNTIGRMGHILRHDSLLHGIIKGRMKGKPTRVRRRFIDCCCCCLFV